MLASSSFLAKAHARAGGASRFVALVLWCWMGAAAQESYCSFEVVVRDASGSPVGGVPVGIVEHGSQGATAWTDKRGVARLCDGPLHAVDIVIGANSCASGIVLVKNVTPAWPKTRNVFAIYSPSPCDDGFSLPDHCQLLLRVQDERGKPMMGAQFEGKQARTSPGSRSSDAFGRIFGSLERGQSLAGLITSIGYEPERVSVECTEHGTSLLEKRVTLRK